MNNTLLRSYCCYCKILFCKHDYEYNMILKKFVILKKIRDFENNVIFFWGKWGR